MWRKCILVASSATAFALFGNWSHAGLAGAGYTTDEVPATGWVGAPVYTSLVDATSASVGQGTAAPQDTGGPAGVNYTVLSELFTPQTTFPLDKIAIVAGGGAETNNQLRLHLYPVLSGGGTNFPSGNPGAAGDNFYFPGTDLFDGGSGAGLAFNFPGFSGRKIVNFDLTGGDEVTLNAGQVYALEVWVPATNPGIFFWYRAGSTPFDPFGQMMGTRDAENFSASRNSIAALGLAPGARTGGLALYAVPEPSSLAVLGLGIGACLARRRQRTV
ncbi:PEP-CTERM sorting domain-containing protein [Fontivita pretiosa]|uniref:PEP-CTERM sorting domain-containing protein n=1 Tax=Fontivita pretiosa TaxID=2989684 RepID=UPI003D16A034